MRVPAGYAARACTWEDLGAVAGLIRAADLVDVGFADPVRDHVEAGWRMPGYDLARDSVAIEWNGSVVAQASVEGVNPDHALDVFGRVHPEHRARGLGAALLDWSERRALQRSPSLEFLRGGVPTGATSPPTSGRSSTFSRTPSPTTGPSSPIRSRPTSRRSVGRRPP